MCSTWQAPAPLPERCAKNFFFVGHEEIYTDERGFEY
jgi:hypothetical protein